LKYNIPIVVNFLANETSNVITIPITNDSLAEGNETINLTLSNPTNGFNLAGQTTATLTITENDNDSPITLIVNTTSDEADGTNSGTGLSLRDAIITANNDTTHDYIIQLQGGQTYSLSIKNTAPVHEGGDEQAALRGDLDILGGGRITIKSVGTQKAIVDATNLKTNFASGFGDSAFDLKDNGHLILDGVTVTGASIAAVFIADTAIAEILNSTITNNVITVASAGNEINQDGGGIFNAGTLILKNSLISNNKAAAFGGGIYNYGKSTTIILNSTLDGNTAGGYGGGIGNSGIANIINSTISNNSSEQYGGGISNAGIATFTNSTISGNTAKQSGGGIFSVNLTSSTVTGKVYLNNSTITNNTADLDSTSDGTGGGIYNIDGYGEVYARNTIIAGNFDTPNNNGSGSGATYNPDISGTIYGNNYNLVCNKTGASGTIGTGTDIVNANPLLGTLQNNGGSTQTHALLTGSPALNKGNNALIAKDVFDLDNDGNNTETIPFDNRGSGYTRIYGGTVDIGAFEFQPPAINLSTNQSIVEGFTSPQNLGYTVTLSIASTQTITVQYATANGTAIAASDYTSTSGTLTFNPGVTSQVINIPILNDSINEANETFTLTLSSPTNANLGTTTTVTTTITDTLTASVTTTLPANVENLTLTGTTPINGTGNAGNNIITGNTVNNILNGGAGNDTLIGGLGNDIYQVDSTTDVITENASEGTDTIQSSVTYTIASLANIENLTLTASSVINGTGNAGNNILTDNTANNTLNSGDGNDTLNGGTGVDALIGGLGNDIYQVDSTTDVITENANEGTDTIQSSVTYTIASLANIENLTLTGSSVINGTGNAANNSLNGNTANNTLNGGDGNDSINGGAGNDILQTFII
jgi:Ca2+-binding RTX toxin-like protein